MAWVSRRWHDDLVNDTATATATPLPPPAPDPVETGNARTQKYVYDFEEGSREMRNLLGGKGSNLCEMTRLLGADLVPGGFVITTEACVAHMTAGSEPPELSPQIDDALERLQTRLGRRFGDANDPLLLSVRSGSRESMPGMMDTVLNLGLTDASVEGLALATGNERFAWDSYRRFVQMFSNVVRGVSSEHIEEEIAEVKARHGVALDTDLDTAALRELTAIFKRDFQQQTGEPFPQDPAEQLKQAINAVFDSWGGDRAVAYRRINHIPDDWGTAVNVQQMVFGNKGESSGSGVAFSRDELTGSPDPSGDFLINAQGEDVVSGVRNAQELAELREIMPDAYAQLTSILRTLEAHYGDIQDTEFTIEEGRLYMLQTRNAKRPAQAAVRFAVDAVGEGLLTKAQAITTIDASSLDALLHPTFDRRTPYKVLARGVAASPGAAKGAIVFSAPAAVAAAETGAHVVLVRPFTEAEDVAGFFAAQGILTSEGGKASHAALVARGMGRPCVCGASSLDIDVAAATVRVGDVVLREGDLIAINGSTGDITIDDVALVDPEMDPNFETVLTWADELRTLGVRANADVPEDARRARAFGAEGIGLCRTEHMFMAADRQPKMRAMIMARARRTAALRWRSCCRCSRRTSRACSKRWRACRSRSACSTRRCTSSFQARSTCSTSCALRTIRTRSPSSNARSSAYRSSPSPTRCSGPAAAALASSTRRSTRCRSRRSCARLAQCASVPATPRTPR